MSYSGHSYEKHKIFQQQMLLLRKKSVAGCRIIHNKSRPKDAHPHFKYAEMKEEKVKNLKNTIWSKKMCLQMKWIVVKDTGTFFKPKKHWRSKESFTGLGILIINLIEISLNFDGSFIGETSMKHYRSFMFVKIAMKLHVKLHWNFS